MKDVITIEAVEETTIDDVSVAVYGAAYPVGLVCVDADIPSHDITPSTLEHIAEWLGRRGAEGLPWWDNLPATVQAQYTVQP